MNKIQRKRLNALANFIEKNPEEFNQVHGGNCIVGLGNRLVRGKLKPDSWDDTPSEFAARYGVTDEEARNIYWGYWSRVNRKTKDVCELMGASWVSDSTQVANVPARRAVLFLRQIVKNHA